MNEKYGVPIEEKIVVFLFCFFWVFCYFYTVSMFVLRKSFDDIYEELVLGNFHEIVLGVALIICH